MSKPESFVRATPEELHGWWLERFWAGPDIKAALAALRDAVVAEVSQEHETQMSRLRDLRHERDDLARQALDAKARAERAEAEVARLTREVKDSRVRRDELVGLLQKAEAALADAQRAGADELQRKAFVAGASWVASYAQSTGELKFHSGPASTRYVSARAEAERRYAPPAPEPPSVRLGSVTVTYVGGTNPWRSSRIHGGRPMWADWADVIGMCHAEGLIPSATEYAALVALAQEAK